MKLVLDLVGFRQGKAYGFQEYISNLLVYFKDNRESICADDIIIACECSQVRYFQDLTGSSFRVHPVSCTGIIGRLVQSHRLPNCLSLSQEDVILYPGNTMPLWGGNKCKKVLVVHDLLFRHGEICSTRLSFLLFRLHKYIYVPCSLRRATRVIAISEFTKEEIIHYYGIPSSKIEVIYNYFDFGKYGRETVRKVPDEDGDFVLAVCSGVQHKNHAVLLEGFRMLLETEPNVRCIIVGGLHPDSTHILETYPKALRERIRIISHITDADLGYLYAHAKVYVSASCYEGLGMPVVEAMSFGVPVVLSDIAIHREVSLGQANYFPKESPDGLYRSLKEVLSSEMRIGDERRASLIRHYSDENTSKRYIELINDIMRN